MSVDTQNIAPNKYELSAEDIARYRLQFRPTSSDWNTGAKVSEDVTPDDSEAWARECNPSLAKSY